MALPVRAVHVLGMGVLLGGAALAWAQFERARGDGGPDRRTLDDAWRYERLFWLAVGVVVPTGVGNAGAMAPAVPDPSTGWGLAFAVKLGGVVVLLVGSSLRTALVWVGRRGPGNPAGGVLVLRVAYAATTLWLGAVVVLAEVLAHG